MRFLRTVTNESRRSIIPRPIVKCISRRYDRMDESAHIGRVLFQILLAGFFSPTLSSTADGPLEIITCVIYYHLPYKNDIFSAWMCSYYVFSCAGNYLRKEQRYARISTMLTLRNDRTILQMSRFIFANP